MRTSGATQDLLEKFVLAALSLQVPRTCQAVITYVLENVELSSEAKALREKRPGEPQFNLIVRNSLEDNRPGNLLDRGYVVRPDRDQYLITDAGIKRLSELQRWQNTLDELFSEDDF